jgi:hypothetical protein
LLDWLVGREDEVAYKPRVIRKALFRDGPIGGQWLEVNPAARRYNIPVDADCMMIAEYERSTDGSFFFVRTRKAWLEARDEAIR